MHEYLEEITKYEEGVIYGKIAVYDSHRQLQVNTDGFRVAKTHRMP